LYVIGKVYTQTGDGFTIMECDKSAKEEEHVISVRTKAYTIYCPWVLQLQIRECTLNVAAV